MYIGHVMSIKLRRMTRKVYCNDVTERNRGAACCYQQICQSRFQCQCWSQDDYISMQVPSNDHQSCEFSNNLSDASWHMVQEMKDTDPEKRVDFCNYVLEQNLATPDWSNNIVFSDEATFHLNGKVNLHNCFYLCKWKFSSNSWGRNEIAICYYLGNGFISSWHHPPCV